MQNPNTCPTAQCTICSEELAVVTTRLQTWTYGLCCPECLEENREDWRVSGHVLIGDIISVSNTENGLRLLAIQPRLESESRAVEVANVISNAVERMGAMTSLGNAVSELASRLRGTSGAESEPEDTETETREYSSVLGLDAEDYDEIRRLSSSGPDRHYEIGGSNEGFSETIENTVPSLREEVDRYPYRGSAQRQSTIIYPYAGEEFLLEGDTVVCVDSPDLNRLGTRMPYAAWSLLTGIQIFNGVRVAETSDEPTGETQIRCENERGDNAVAADTSVISCEAPNNLSHFRETTIEEVEARIDAALAENAVPIDTTPAIGSAPAHRNLSPEQLKALWKQANSD